MTLLEQIKTASLTARKERNATASSLLITLLSDVTMVGKNKGTETTDAEAIAIIKKYVENNNLTISKIADADSIAKLNEENSILNQFLPKQMTEDEVKIQLTQLKESLTITDAKGLGKLLAGLKTQFAGQYDGAVAAKVAKELLA